MTEERNIDWTAANRKIARDATSLFTLGFLDGHDSYIPGAENKDLRLQFFAGFGAALYDFAKNDSVMQQMEINPFKRKFDLVHAVTQQIEDTTESRKACGLGCMFAMNRMEHENALAQGNQDILRSFVFKNNMEYFNKLALWVLGDYYDVVPNIS
jgi:hypothetical protein